MWCCKLRNINYLWNRNKSVNKTAKACANWSYFRLFTCILSSIVCTKYQVWICRFDQSTSSFCCHIILNHSLNYLWEVTYKSHSSTKPILFLPADLVFRGQYWKDFNMMSKQLDRSLENTLSKNESPCESRLIVPKWSPKVIFASLILTRTIPMLHFVYV